MLIFFFSSRRRHTRFSRDWSSDVCSSDLILIEKRLALALSPCIDFAIAGFTSLTAGDELAAQVREFILERLRSWYADQQIGAARSEERRVGREGGSRWSSDHSI